MESLDFGIKKCLLRSFFNDTITPWIVRDEVQLLINRIYIVKQISERLLRTLFKRKCL